MRSSAVTVLTVLAFLSGCTSSSGPEAALTIAPSRETTASIDRPGAPVPPAPVAGARMAAAPSAKGARLPAPEPLVANAPSPAVEQTTELAWAGGHEQAQAFAAFPQAEAAAVPGARPQTPRAGGKQKIYSQRFSDAKPINFGKVQPKHFAVHGVDVSRWQGNIDWQKLRGQGANFVFIKATDGGDHVDPMFRANWRGAREAGLKHGAYHFFYWCRTASEQAEWFIRNVPREPGALPPVIDVEYNHLSSCKTKLSRERIIEKMQVFMDMLERHYGQRPIIYTAPDFYADNLQGAFRDYPFWLRSVAAHPSKRYPNRKWLFWQYSGSGLSKGVSEKIDLNVFNGDADTWHRWLRNNST